MVDTGPLESYLEGIEAYKKGDKEGALKLLANSIGSEEATPYIRANIDKLIKSNSAMLTLILNESK